jgi:hypothetical protein
VPQIRIVSSPVLALAPGETTYGATAGGNWEAACPSGYTAIGTGFNDGAVAQVGFVLSYGSFVGGFIANNSSITVNVSLEAMCGVVPQGSVGLPAVAADAASRQSSAKRYHSDLASEQARFKAAH